MRQAKGWLFVAIWGCCAACVPCSAQPGPQYPQPPQNSRASQGLPAFLTADDAFEGVEPPDWVLDGVAKVFLGLEDLQGIEEAADLGATVLHAGGPSLYVPLRRDDPLSGVPEPERSRMLKGIGLARQRDMRVILGISPYAPKEMVRQHPEWIARLQPDAVIPNLAEIDWDAPEYIGLRALPLNTPYADYAIECLAEIMRDYQVDGFSFDGCYHMPINFSQHERDLYLRETGRPLPQRMDLNDPEYRVYLWWADEKLEDWYRRLGQQLQQVNPEAAIYTWTTNAGRYGHFLTSPRVMSARMNRLIHCPVQEWWLDEVNLGATVVPYFGAAYVRAASGGRVGASEPYLMSRGNPYTTDSFPAHELTVRCLGAMTNGCFTPLAQMAGRDATWATLKEIADRQDVFARLTPKRWGAILVSEQSRQFYGYGNVMERWLAHALGAYRMAMEEHLPFTLLTEVDLRPEVLDQYAVLMLPNVTCLSDAQVACIRQYVHGGGGLVATCETSLFDELGQPRDDFALRDLFGTSYGGRQEVNTAPRPDLDANFSVVVDDKYWAHRGQAGDFRFSDFPDSILATEPRFRRILPNLQATFKGPLVRPSGFGGSMQPIMLYFPEGSREAFPVGAYGRYGQGKVVYFAAGVDAALFSYGFPYQRIMLAAAVHWAASRPAAVEVQAPMCVQATYWTQPGRPLVVHLWNGLNTTADHGLQDVETPLREESIPIHGIQIRVSDHYYRQARCVPGGELLVGRQEGEQQVFDIPPVHVHTGVVFEE
jgi:hypothetical protein